MFPTYNLRAAVPLQSHHTAPMHTPAQVDAFIDRFEAPPHLRDPFTTCLFRQPVAMREANGVLEDICVEESSLRRAVAEGRSSRPGVGLDAPLAGSRMIAHGPMRHQLFHFYDAALARCQHRHGTGSERYLALSHYIDSALFDAQQPLMPILDPVERTLTSQNALVPLQQAGYALARLRINLELLLPRIEREQERLIQLESRRQSLLFDLSALWRHIGDARKMMWRLMSPPAQFPPSFFRDWRRHYEALHTAACDHEETVLVEIPMRLTERARAQTSAAEAILRNASRSAASSP